MPGLEAQLVRSWCYILIKLLKWVLTLQLDSFYLLTYYYIQWESLVSYIFKLLARESLAKGKFKNFSYQTFLLYSNEFMYV